MSEARATIRGQLDHNGLCEMLVENLTIQGWSVYRLFAPGRRRTSKGIPDLYAMRERTIWLEAKVGRDELSIEQKAFFGDAARAGVQCYEVRPENVDDVLENMR